MNPIIESLNNYASANRWKEDGTAEQHVHSGQLEFPVIRHQPLTGKIGRNDGFMAYKFSLLLLDKRENENAILDEDIRKCLEQHARGMIRTLKGHPQVRNVNMICCRPAESALTHGEGVALAVTLEVDILTSHNPNHS